MTTEGSEPEHYAVLELRRLRAALNETVSELIGRWSASERAGDWPAAAEELQLAMFTLADRTAPAGPTPEELAVAELEVLSLNWMTVVKLSHAYRAAGHDIDPKMEAECGFVLQRLLGFARKHGIHWREHAVAELKDMMAAKAASADSGPL
ncbi:hypothetical protein Q0M94_02275 [Deinococcus radiomollis]|uniref:hypothetical protein n=1 Tax=Deinococcus radiomollis TaxID=468916 RepID=UPI0038914B97